MMDVKGKNALVVGMAKSGIASAKLLNTLGARVAVCDDKTNEQLGDVLVRLPFAEDCLGRPAGECLSGRDLVVLSPGVPITSDWVFDAVSEGCLVVGEIELASWYIEAQIVAITGTNGKTTTTALTGEMFKNAGRTTHVIGNIGIPMTERALDICKDDIVVAEVAGFQLESTIDFHPRACAILNITPDHLDRFGDMETYTASKTMIFNNMDADDYIVLNADDKILSDMRFRFRRHYLWFSRRAECYGAYAKDGNIFLNLGEKRILCPVSDLRIPGEHNLENALAAVILASIMGVEDEVIVQTLKTFKGVEHRIEFVREYKGVKYINDSKGTNTDASVKAVDAMDTPTVLIAGGYDKNADFTEFIKTWKGRVTAAVALGQTADRIIGTAYNLGFTNIHKAEDFEEAVLTAARLAKDGDSVLLSPACASWDMFRDFEQRGEQFKDIVNRLETLI